MNHDHWDDFFKGEWEPEPEPEDHAHTCPSCAGHGEYAEGGFHHVCTTCKGTGTVPRED